MSTLMASSAFVYCEPPWSYALDQEEISNQLSQEKEKIVVKFQSSLCHIAKNFSDKKVFLHRKLRHHLFKIKTSQYIYDIAVNKFKYHQDNCHSSLKDFKFESDLEKVLFTWANNIQWMRESTDVLWIESNDFFKNKKEVMNKVCDYLELEPVKNFEISNFYVKSFGLNGNEGPINNLEVPNLGDTKSLYPSYGIVEDDLSKQCDDINQLIEWSLKNLTFISKDLLE